MKETEVWFACPADPDAIAIIDPRIARGVIEKGYSRQADILETFVQHTCYRKRVRVSSKCQSRVESLATDFPHFLEVIEFYRRAIALCLRGRHQYLAASPLLLNGPPGIGKTRFATCLAQALGTEYHEICCSTVTANFVLSGNSGNWSEAKPGKIFESLRTGKTANPIMLLDEIDKLAGDWRYDGFGPLYGLLEKTTAKRFEDENVALPMDCSHILWIGTSNGLDTIPEAILSRFRVMEVSPPTRAQMPAVLRSIYKAILQENPDWSRSFSDQLEDGVIDRLNGASPRAMKQLLLEACGNAALRWQGKPECSLLPCDLSGTPPASRRPIGFIS